jgi:hypothetical protein
MGGLQLLGLDETLISRHLKTVKSYETEHKPMDFGKET